jgi:LuxR family maltose regulon positive regulatory protein
VAREARPRTRVTARRGRFQQFTPVWAEVESRIALEGTFTPAGSQCWSSPGCCETDDILSRWELGAFTGEAEEVRHVLGSTTTAGVGRLSLTPAELRLLPYLQTHLTDLQTHLTAGGIAEQMFVSSHTVKTEVKWIYRKLGVSSRHDAVQKATAIGLLGA